VRAAVDLGQKLARFALDCAQMVNDGEVDGVGCSRKAFRVALFISRVAKILLGFGSRRTGMAILTFAAMTAFEGSFHC